MGFYRFESLKSHHLNPHLSTTQGPVIEGQYMYFRRVTKQGGTRSKPHYHPNEFMAFLLEGRTHAVLGKGRRVVGPGTLVHIPSNARHSFLAIEDIKYLYVKDRTWTLIGAAANEALPEQAMSATEVAKALKAGNYPGRRGTARDSGRSSMASAIVSTNGWTASSRRPFQDCMSSGWKAPTSRSE